MYYGKKFLLLGQGVPFVFISIWHIIRLMKNAVVSISISVVDQSGETVTGTPYVLLKSLQVPHLFH